MRIGTRGSALALAQARWVASRFQEGGAGLLDRPSEIVPVVTAGDRGQGVGDKERWVSELERALLAGEIDVAVHSAKDVPAVLADGTTLAAFPVREDPFDVLCGASSLDGLPSGARIGTSSLRRRAQLLATRPDLQIVELRGNVDTRLRKLAAGEADAIVVAAAGLVRLDRAGAVSERLDALVPAAGQGALALQCLAAGEAARLVAAIDDPAVSVCVEAERTVIRALGASCHTAVGVHCRPEGSADPGQVSLAAWAGLPDGSEWIADRLVGRVSEIAGRLSERMLAAGAAELLA